jgi:hypothetical protein
VLPKPLRLQNALLRSPVGRAAARLARRRILHVFGDSHTWVFHDIWRRGLLRRTWLDFLPVGGTTASGMTNPDSKRQAAAKFRQVIDRLPRDEHLLFMIGAAETTYLLWYQAESKGRSVEVGLDRAFTNYTSFLQSLRDEGRRNLVVAGVPLPVASDQDATDERLGPLRRVSASLAQRTALTRTYNQMLRSWAAEHGCRFLDYEGDILDARRGVIREELRRENPVDLHLNFEVLTPILVRRLAEIGYP